MVDRLALRAWRRWEVTPRATAHCAIHPGADHASESFRDVSQQSWHGGWIDHRDHTAPSGSALDGRHSHPSLRRDAIMTQSQPEFSPYDTGTRCEPKLWQPNTEAVAEVMRSGEAGDVGNVDFTDDEDSTVVPMHVSRSDDGMYTHRMPTCEDDQIRVELHREKDLAVIDLSACRPA
ncbi:hypothetical protein ABZ379_06510 [Streptomyces canus]|uniref:hypothetical protein n=1 Tax=Streptomyces canus TaxID=58343 RepID=UPI0033C1A925